MHTKGPSFLPQTPNRTDCRKPGGEVGISWFIQHKEGHTIISHSGGNDGFVTDLILVPDAGTALVLMLNSSHPGLTLPQKIVKEFWGLLPNPAAAAQVQSLTNGKG